MSRSPLAWPRVSVIMPVVNEERHLAAAVARILDQDYPGSIDVAIAVAPSRDRTQAVADELARDARVIVVANPSGRTPAGLNAAIAATSGEIVVRVDGHAMIPDDYIRTAVETLTSTGADNVGGIMAAEGSTPFECAVARAMTSRFGVGGAAFHVGGEAGPALTVYLGAFPRAALQRVGGYDESMVRAQDWELNLRIRQTGGQIWFTPAMRVTYRPRPSLGALARQYHDYGRWRREVVDRYPSTVSLRYLAPPLALAAFMAGLALGVIGLLAALPWLAVLGFAMPIGYLVLVMAASAVASVRPQPLAPASMGWLPVVFATMHGAWGAGFWRGARTKGRSSAGQPGSAA